MFGATNAFQFYQFYTVCSMQHLQNVTQLVLGSYLNVLFANLLCDLLKLLVPTPTTVVPTSHRLTGVRYNHPQLGSKASDNHLFLQKVQEIPLNHLTVVQ